MPAADAASLSVLLTNIRLDGRTGTEIVTRDLALGLLRAGHRPRVYSPVLGPIADELRLASVPVTDDISSIRERPDVIHGHHVIQTGVAAARFPDIPAIFVCHDFTSWYDRPPKLPNIRAYVAISDGFADRLTIEGGIDPERVEVVLNGVDTGRFIPGPALPLRPRKAVAFLKGLTNRDALEAACAQRGIDLDLVGRPVGRVIDAPEQLLPQYDLVFASALTAIEAMAAGRAVIVAEGRGLAGFVDTAALAGWRRENFGARTFKGPVTVDGLLAQIDRYDAAQAQAVSARVRAEAGLDAWADRYVNLYRRVITAHAAAGSPSPEAAAEAMALHLQTWNPLQILSDWRQEHSQLLDRIAELEEGLTDVAPGTAVFAGDGKRLVLNGFHSSESWGVWSAQPHAAVRFSTAPGTAFSRITLAVQPLLTPERATYDLACSLDGTPLGVIALSADESCRAPKVFDLPEPVAGGEHRLDFTTPGCVSPQGDGRSLGFGLLSLRVD